MRTKLSVLILTSLLCLPFFAEAQTNGTNAVTPTFQQTTNFLAGIGLGGGTSQVIGTAVNQLVDAQPYFTNGDFLAEVGTIKYGKSYGALVDLQVPVNTNSWQITYGTAIGYVNKTVYSATIPVTLGTTMNIPVVSDLVGPFYDYVESGPGYNFKKNQAVVQSLVGIKYAYNFSPRFGLVGSAGYGLISDIGIVRVFTVGFTYKFK